MVRGRVLDHLEGLSPITRTAVVLHLVEGYTAAEIAEITEARLGTVRDRILRGRSKLRRSIVEDPILREWFQERAR